MVSRPSFLETFGIVFACVAALVALSIYDKRAHDAHTERATAALERMERERTIRDETVRPSGATSARVERPGRVPIFIPHGGALGISPAAAITESDYASAATPSAATAARRVEGPTRPAPSNPIVSAIETAAAPPATAPARAAAPAARPEPQPAPPSPLFAIMAVLGLLCCGAGVVLRRY